nr:hypothetical protein Itr_chr03CG10710 [Ipomoea trifida]
MATLGLLSGVGGGCETKSLAVFWTPPRFLAESLISRFKVWHSSVSWPYRLWNRQYFDLSTPWISVVDGRGNRTKFHSSA